MKTLLRIDASARQTGSHSRELADHFQSRWLKAHPGGQVVVRDLVATPVPHLNNSTIAAFTAGDGTHNAASDPAVTLSDLLIAELNEADEVVISSPLYNFGPPTPLKAYLDHVVRFGRTFTQNENGYQGMLRGKSVCLLTACGGVAGPDFQGALLQTVFQFIGFERVEWIALEGTSLSNGQLSQHLRRVQAQINAWFEPAPQSSENDQIEWHGNFSAQDRTEINALRAAQVRAIVAGDAGAYAGLCADDVLLMLQGQDMVSGRGRFLECETTLLQGTRFVAMQQFPLRVERQGLLAIETGRQEVLTAASATHAESFKARRKYLHVLRKSAAGWRFAALISNNSL